MSNPKAPKRIRFFPRNLTARSDYLVRGNPANSRVEDSVGNTIPGLEFDERNLDKYFFPGLVIEFQRATATEGPNSKVKFDRPLLRDFSGAPAPDTFGMRQEDVAYAALPEVSLIHLWAVRTPDDRVLSFYESAFDDGFGGLGPWRAIRDMRQGQIAILIATIAVRQDREAFRGALQAFAGAKANQVTRDSNGRFAWASLVGESRKWLNDEGVIDLGIPSGELQSTMCTPWQYDFRDCKCYYWSANRPDVAAAVDGSQEFVKFMRKDLDLPTIPSTVHDDWLTINGRTHVDVINEWEDLRVVLDDREVSYQAMLIENVRKRFRELATVEHALAVEYLFSYYSIDDTNPAVSRAAADILSVALDEMRHFRWVNEILAILGEPPTVDRAADYGANFDNRKFQLAPLTEDRLAWFIQVEKPSQSLDIPGQIDGMYVRLYQTIEANQSAFPRPEELLRLVKLLIDDGETHYQIFTSVQSALTQRGPFSTFLYPVKSGQPDPQSGALIEIADALYASVLSLLATAFHLYNRANGIDLQKSVRSMQSMDGVNKQVAHMGYPPRFTLPSFASAGASHPAASLTLSDEMLSRAEARLDALPETPQWSALAKDAIAVHRVASSEMRDAMVAIHSEPIA